MTVGAEHEQGSTDAAVRRIRGRSGRACSGPLGLQDRRPDQPGAGGDALVARRGSRPRWGNSDAEARPRYRSVSPGLGARKLEVTLSAKGALLLPLAGEGRRPFALIPTAAVDTVP